MSLSVLMAVYYKENPLHFQLALESVINQTYPPAEIVLVKDGQLTAELDQVIDQYLIRYPNLFNVITLPQNKGLGEALNAGLQACSYDLVARMDTDDIAACDRFEKQYAHFSKDKELAVLGSFIAEFDQDVDQIISERQVPLSYQEIYEFARHRNPFNHMTVMLRRQAVLDAGSYRPFLWYEDYYLWVRMLQQGFKAANIPENLVYVRAGEAMYARRGGVHYLLNEIKLQQEFLRMGFISPAEFASNLVVRLCVRLCPNKVRGLFYRKFLRKAA